MYIHSSRTPSPTDPASAALNSHISSSAAHDLHACSPIAPGRTFLQPNRSRIYSPTALPTQGYSPAAPKLQSLQPYIRTDTVDSPTALPTQNYIPAAPKLQSLQPYIPTDTVYSLTAHKTQSLQLCRSTAAELTSLRF